MFPRHFSLRASFVIYLGLLCGCGGGLAIETSPTGSGRTDVIATPIEQVSAGPEQQEYYSPAETCESMTEPSEKRICNALIKDQDLEHQVLANPLKYYSRKVDLNGDRANEVFIWMPSLDLGGTSGYPIIIYESELKRFRRVMLTDSWTPIIVLNSVSKGWKDVAVQVTGGGVDTHYLVFRYDGHEYKVFRRSKDQPNGKIVIDKDWKNSVFGPIPNQK